MKAAQIPCDIVVSPYAYSPACGDLPVLKWQTQLVPSQENIFWLQANFCDLDESIDVNQRADASGFSAMVYDRLYPAMMYTQWGSEENYTTTTRYAYAAQAPFPVGAVLRLSQRRKMRSFARTHNVNSMEEASAQARAVYEVLAGKLGKQSFYFSDNRLSSLDLTVAAFIAVQLHSPCPVNPLKDMLLKDFPELVRHCKSVLRSCLKDYHLTQEEEKTIPVAVALRPKLRTPLVKSAAEEQKKKEELVDQARKVRQNNTRMVVFGVATLAVIMVLLRREARAGTAK